MATQLHELRDFVLQSIEKTKNSDALYRLAEQQFASLTIFKSLALLLSGIAAYYFARAFYTTFLWYPFLSSNSKLPGPPRDSWLRGNLKDIFEGEPGVIHQQWSEKYGNVVRYSLFTGSERLMITDPKALQRIILTDSYEYPKPNEIRGDLAKILGKGILFAEGDTHRNQKRILSPAFNGPNVNALLPVFHEKAEILRFKFTDLIENASGAWSGDVSALVGRCALDIIGVAGLGTEFNTQEDSAHPLATAFGNLFGEPIGRGFIQQALFFLFLTFPILRILPTKRARLASETMQTMRDESKKVLDQAKASAQAGEKSGAKDLLTLLVKANLSGDEKGRLTDAEVMGQMTTFLLAGYETTSTALMWCLLELARNPEVQSKLRTEVRQAKEQFGLSTSDGLSVEQLSGLSYLDSVTKETLRVRAPVPNTLRQASKDDVVPLASPVTLKDGSQITSLHLKKGSTIFMPLRTINMLPSIWGENAAEFDPTRWSKLPDTVAAGTTGFTIYSHLFTFLGGPRGCIGFRFALLEFKTILATLVETLQFDEHDEHKDIIGKAFLVTRPYLKAESDAGLKTRSQMPLKVSIAA